MFIARNFYISTGCGRDIHAIASFDKALLMAGMGNYNLVRVSSIIPPDAKQVDCVNYPAGSVVFTAYATINTKANELIASAIAAAIPKDPTYPGVIMEYSCKGDKKHAELVAKKLAEEALQRRNIFEYDVCAAGIEAHGVEGTVTTTFAAIALI